MPPTPARAPVRPPARPMLAGLALVVAWALAPPASDARAMDRVRVSDDGRGFVLEPSGRPFTPWGFNYDHDTEGRLIEDYWADDWPKVEADFRAMRALGANVVRVHLQLGKFLTAPDRADAGALERLGKLLALAESVGLYLDLTGLGCYHKADVPAWYDALDEPARWAAQTRFWTEVARRGAKSPAVFCYDLMNEPVVSGGKRGAGDWLGPAFAGKHFVQFVALDPAGRPRPEVAKAWIRTLATAVRAEDPKGLVTVGLVDWSLDRPGLSSGFVPREVAPLLDFLCVHLYPSAGKLEADLETLRGFAVGKPLVIEETFPLKCGSAEFAEFVEASSASATGWIGFFWGKTPAQLRPAKTIPDALMLGWLEFFEKGPPAARPAPCDGAIPLGM